MTDLNIPAGATKITDPSGLQGLTESQIYRVPGSPNIYKLPPAQPASPAPMQPVTSAQQPQAMNPLAFSSVLSTFQDKLNANNKLAAAKTAVLNALYNRPPTPEELAQLDPQTAAIIQKGDRNEMEMLVRAQNDQLTGRADSINTAMKFMTTDYNNQLQLLNQQKQQSFDNVMKAYEAGGSKAFANAPKSFLDNFKQEYGVDLTAPSLNELQNTQVLTDNQGNQYIVNKSTGQVLQSTSDITSGQARQQVIQNADTTSIVNAIKQIESGGDYNAKGSSGESGAYQFMPATWAQYSAEWLKSQGKAGMSIPMTPENQDAVATFKIDQWLKQGYTADQIASLWNSGKPDYQGKSGVNKQGVKYDVPSYVNRFLNELSKSSQMTTGGGGLSPEALDQAAQKYIQSGILPTGLSKNIANQRTAILNRAAELSSGDLAISQAKYKADSSALTQLQKQSDLSTSFERTATKNLELAQSLSKKVDRSGSPLLNQYVLYVQGKIAGNSDLLAFETAIKTATNEYAKVTTGQTTGAAVSDSARRETETMLNATYSQEAFDNVVATMKSEMQNRLQGFSEQRQQILDRMGSSGTPSTMPTTSNDPLGIR